MEAYKDLICFFYDYVPIANAEELGFDSEEGKEKFLIVRALRPGSGAHPTSYPMGTGVYFPGDKAAGERS
jgi:hypothetical protein